MRFNPVFILAALIKINLHIISKGKQPAFVYHCAKTMIQGSVFIKTHF